MRLRIPLSKQKTILTKSLKKAPVNITGVFSISLLIFLVEVVGFELTTSWSRTKRATPALHLDVFRDFF